MNAASSAAQGAMTSDDAADDDNEPGIDDIDENPMDIMEDELMGGSSARACEDVARSRAVTLRATARREREALDAKDMGEGGGKEIRVGQTQFEKQASTPSTLDSSADSSVEETASSLSTVDSSPLSVV